MEEEEARRRPPPAASSSVLRPPVLLSHHHRPPPLPPLAARTAAGGSGAGRDRPPAVAVGRSGFVAQPPPPAPIFRPPGRAGRLGRSMRKAGARGCRAGSLKGTRPTRKHTKAAIVRDARCYRHPQKNTIRACVARSRAANRFTGLLYYWWAAYSGRCSSLLLVSVLLTLAPARSMQRRPIHPPRRASRRTLLPRRAMGSLRSGGIRGACRVKYGEATPAYMGMR